MSTLPSKRVFVSPDRRRLGSYEPHVMDTGSGKPTSAYRVVRTVRTRKGFGTIIHTLTTFVHNKKRAHAMAARWVRVNTVPKAPR